MLILLILSFLVIDCNAKCLKEYRKFPKDFCFGATTAAYQIEGGWNKDRKSPSIWDYLTHSSPELIKDHSNGDIAADSYHNYKRDVEMMRELGLDVYRMSISWPRILPNGYANEINKAGVKFYDNYINEMLKYNITPVVTIYHWDLPQKLQDLGGLSNILFLQWYEDYARVLFKLFGDRVKFWITFNEPKQICYFGYGSAKMAPVLDAHGVGEYLCAKHLVMAHAKAYHLYNNEFKSSQGGECGITMSVTLDSAATDSEEDEAAAELMRQVDWGIYTEPIFSEEGGFPKEIVAKVAEKSNLQGYPRSRMPEFTEEEKCFVRGTFDFLGVNHYTSYLVSATEHKTNHPIPSMYDDAGGGFYIPEEWSISYGGMALKNGSLYEVLKFLSEKYNYPVIHITESGIATSPETGIQDDERSEFYRKSLTDVLDAIDDNVRVKSFMAWSLMDNFEWMQGYSTPYGLYFVDFEDPARIRTPKQSAFVYKEIIRTRSIDYCYQPDTFNMTIDEGH